MIAVRISAAALGSILSCTALAQSRPGENVAATGCVRPGVEATCLMISGPGGTLFNITGANPKPPRDEIIELRGIVTDRLSMCNQGTVLDQISWTSTGRKCPN